MATVSWDVLENGTTPWGGHWFTVVVDAPEKGPSGRTRSWFEFEEGEAGGWPEEPETLYIELDAAEGMTKTKLQTYIQGPETEAIADTMRRITREVPEHLQEEAREEALSNFEETIYLYDSTTDVSEAERAREAIDMAVNDTIRKWLRAPYAGGERVVIRASDRYRPVGDFARMTFEVDPGFYGVEP